MSLKTNKNILPGDKIEIDTEMADQTVLVEGHNRNHWPEPQVVTISRGKFPVTNNTTNTVILNKGRVNSIKVTPTEEMDWSAASSLNLSVISTASKQSTKSTSLLDSKTINTIVIGDTTEEIQDLIQAANRRFGKVFS